MAQYECCVSNHGARQFEIRTAYPTNTGCKHTRYHLDLYIFCPYQLGMTDERYGVKRFLEDTISYTRYTVPSIPLEKLVDPACDKSPLTRISKAFASMILARDLDTNFILYELRALTNIYRRQIKDTARLIKTLVKDGIPAEDVMIRLSTFLSEIDALLNKFRGEIRQRLLDANLPDSLRQAAAWADEAISLATEKQYFHLYTIFQKHPELSAASALVEPRLDDERQYRKNRGYKSVVDSDSPDANERYLYHDGMLKKWAEGSMYMSAARNRLSDKITHVVMGVAAGIAMLFAIVATILASAYFAQNSIPWAILIVIMYVFKDRIKEILRAVFAKYLPKLIADKNEDLIDPNVKSLVGKSKIRVRFLSATQTPKDIRQLRYMDTNEFRGILPAEDVIEFHKDMDLDCQSLTSNHPRLESITEILRFKLDHYLEGMDDPTSKLSYYQDGQVKNILANRVYHLNLVARLGKDNNGEPELFHYMIVLNRDGIIRLKFKRGVSAPR